MVILQTTALASSPPAQDFLLSLTRKNNYINFELALQALVKQCRLIALEKRYLSNACLINGAEDEIRTRDPRLGKAMLYH